jgi:Protein of unknown function (DUF2917)
MEAAMKCDGYTKVWDLAPGELVKLDGARGTTLRVTRGVLWITLEDDLRDVILAAGDSFTIDREGLTLVESQGAATVCVLARHADEVRRQTRRPSLATRTAGWLAASAGVARRSAPYY